MSLYFCLEKGYLFILVNLPERVDELDMANIPHETLLASCEAVNDIHRRIYINFLATGKMTKRLIAECLRKLILNSSE